MPQKRIISSYISKLIFFIKNFLKKTLFNLYDYNHNSISVETGYFLMFNHLKTRKMKKMNLKQMLVAVVVMALGGLGVSTMDAQKIETLPVGVTARLASQLSVTKVYDVDFGGIFIPLTATANVRMDFKGDVTLQSGTTSFYSEELRQQGQFYVTADKAASFSIQYPNLVDLVNATKDSQLSYTPAVFDIAGVSIPSSSTTKYSVDKETYKVFNIGGDLAISSASKSGLYHGTFDVTITWE